MNFQTVQHSEVVIMSRNFIRVEARDQISHELDVRVPRSPRTQLRLVEDLGFVKSFHLDRLHLLDRFECGFGTADFPKEFSR
jgi:hypothetical protein